MHKHILEIVNTKSKRIRITGIILCVLVLPGLMFNDDILFYIIKISMILFGIWLIYLGSSRLDNPESHPGIEKFNDNDVFIDLLCEELENKSETEKLKNNIVLTPNFVVLDSFYHFTPYSVQEAVWTYIKQTQHSINFIPTGSSYSVILCFNNGKEIEIKTTKKHSEEILYKLINWAPFIISGYLTPFVISEYDKKLDWNDILIIAHKRMISYYENPDEFLHENYNIKK